MRSALRQFTKSPGFTAAVVGTLALGIGANTALFSVVNGVLLKSLPFDHARRLVWIWSTRTDRDKAFYSIPDFLETRSSVRTLDAMSGYANWGVNLTGSGDAERLAGARITADAFETMGVHSLEGRLIAPSDERSESGRVVVLSHGLWQRRFGGDRSLIGRSLVLNDNSYTVVGVLPPEFTMPATEAELFAPLILETDPMRKDRGTNFIRTFGRLRPGATVRQAAAELAAITRRLREMYPDTDSKHTDPRVLAFQDEITGSYRTALWTLLGAVGLVLLIACSNLANLLLVRATARGREVAIRKALGASRLVLLRLFLGEALLLALAGGALGILLAQWGLQLLLALRPADLPRVSEITLDLPVLVFAMLLTGLCGILFGLAPALHAAGAQIGDHLRSRSSAAGLHHGARGLLPVAEVALSIILLAGAGWFLRSFVRLNAVSPGFAPDHLLLVRLSLPASYSTSTAVRLFYENLLRRLGALPGVESVALGSALPLSGMNVRTDFTIAGRPPATPQDMPAAQNRWISAGYFRAMKIPILAGREFTERDNENAPAVVVVDQALAIRHWGRQSPLGRHIRAFGRDLEVVGVAGGVKHNNIDDAPTPTFYEPFPLVPPQGLRLFAGSFSIVLRTSSDPLSLGTAVRRELKDLDANVPASAIKTMDQFLASGIAPRRFNLQLIALFALAALLLAASGLYAVLSYAVTLRTSEIGLRMALGADRGMVMRLVGAQALRLVLAGIVIGVIAAIVLMRIVSSLFFDTAAGDPLTLLGVVAIFAGVAALAAWIPVRRATRIDPLIALRSE